MIIIKEGMSSLDLNIRNLCLKFLVPSFISHEDVEITNDQLKEILAQKSKGDLQMSILNSRRNSRDSQGLLDE